MKYTAEMLASLLGGKVDGDAAKSVHTFAKIEEGTEGALSFLANMKYEHYIYSTKSSVVIVSSNFVPQNKIQATLIRVQNPYEAFAKLLAIYQSAVARREGVSRKASVSSKAKIGKHCYIGPFAVIDDDAVVGDNTEIFPHVYVGRGAKVGNHTTINPNVTIYNGCEVGDNVIIHAGAVIGADGFGFAPTDNGSYEKIPQIGNVVIKDNVEIGANTCIDRSTMGSTVIEQGVKLDNLIQIAHNVVIGENTVMAAQSGVAGSAKVGRNCMFGGQSGVVGHLTVGDGVKTGAKTGITNNVADNMVMAGHPAVPHMMRNRLEIYTRHLPDLNKRVDELERTVAEMQKK